MSLHSQASIGHIHTPFAWIFPSKAVMEGTTAVTEADLGKICFERETKTLWQLVSRNPTKWMPVGGDEGLSKQVSEVEDSISANLSNEDIEKLSISFIPTTRPLIFFNAEILPPLDTHLYRASVLLNDEEIRVLQGSRGRKDGSILFSGFFSFVLEIDAFYELSIKFRNAQGNARPVSIKNARLVVIGAKGV